MLKDSLIVKTNGKCSPGNIIAGEGFRITVITEQLFRVEISKNNIFEDMATQRIWFRNIGPVDFVIAEDTANLFISTKKVELKFSKTKKKAVHVKFADTQEIAECSNKSNLKGTRRTLDLTLGSAKLGNGLISTSGVAVYDDSKSLTIDSGGDIVKRNSFESDIYVFAYGKEYRQCIRDYYLITGLVPLVPRFALGVWWSRYRSYTQREYIELVQNFEDEDIPMTVATVDMDWHWTDLNKKFGTKYKRKLLTDNPCTGGWTGYSWNTELFPDYRGFLNWLHSKNLKVTLNLHPADGIRFFETMYEEMAEAMGVDPATKHNIPFTVGNADFWNNYFDIVHKPYEKEGVDFWWIDWQQGKKSDVKGLDPLWALNHYHFLDNAENGRLPLILSRYAGIGSHRYPLGFSGDTMIKWRVLKFQPYFTANAANSGYTWWSHDIGGHQLGKRDDELYLRWLQFGVFSPVMRLHSTSNDLLGKEPWRYPEYISNNAKKWLTFRHRLIPYLYTMDYRTNRQGIALVEPTYYKYPENSNSYKIKNEYMFGSQLLVIPITSKTDKLLNLAKVRAWIPEGRWTDIFTGEIFNGEKFATIYRDITTIPVLAKQGAIIPMSADEGNSTENPRNLLLWVFRGNNKFVLYEDNGRCDYENNNAVTKFEISETEIITFTVNAPRGRLDILPASRNFSFIFKDIMMVKKVRVYIDEKLKEECVYEGENISKKAFEIELKNVSVSSQIKIEIIDYRVTGNQPENEKIIDVFSRWQAGNSRKTRQYKKLRFKADSDSRRKKIKRMHLPKSVRKALLDCIDTNHR